MLSFAAAILKTLVRVYSSNLHTHLSPAAALQQTNLPHKSLIKINPQIGLCCYQSSLSRKEETTDDELFRRLLNEIQHQTPASIRQICVDHFSKFIREKNLQAAYKLLQIMRTRSIFLDINTCIIPLLELEAAAAAAGKETDIHRISQLFQDAALSSNGVVQLIPYHSFVKALGIGNDPSLLLRFVKHVSEYFTFFPRTTSTLAVNRIISALAQVGQVDKALLVFRQMQSMFLKCTPDFFSYDIVIEMLGNVGRVDDMVKELGSMKEAHLVPDVYTYNALLNSFRKVGRLDLCLVFAKEMEEKGIEPDLCTYTALIEIFGRSGNVEKSLQLFQKMKDRKIRPSIYIYRSLINSLKKMGKLDRAINLQEEMRMSMSDLVAPKDFVRKRR